ncbi:MAG: response regulator transcription factor [Oxalobacteraceae bacterium]|nr:MAG: response regulator transcription factor [Oxalobacteraceae bacterium]
MRLAVRGLSNREIGRRLGVGVKSIETYKTRINKKLGLSSRAEWVRYALARGWMEEM